jgi:predicted MPP superfamily phosphohydrolase
VPRRTRLITRRRLLTAAVAVGAVGIYTWRIEPHWLEVVRRPLPIRNLPAQLEGKTLAHITDLHIGPNVDDDYLLGVFQLVEAVSPEIVVYTGDLISYNMNRRDRATRVLSRLVRGTLGAFGILGNHDYGPGWHNAKLADWVADVAQDAGVQILRNEVANVEGLTIAGMDDLWADRFDPKRALPQLAPNAASLALIHNPDVVDCAGWDGYSGWILAGHTHGGQCKPPFLPPPIIPVRNRRYTAGEFELTGGRRLYISRGAGHSMRVRFNVRPEVTLFTLTRDSVSLNP